MKADKDYNKLDELISQTIGREVPAFDFGKWKDNHRAETEIFKSQTAGRATSRSVRIFDESRAIVKSRTGRLAAAAVIVIAISAAISYFGGSTNGTAAVYAAATKALQNVRTVHVSGWTTCLRPHIRAELLDTSTRYTVERWEWVTEDGGYRRYTRTGHVTGWDDGDRLYSYDEHDDILYTRKSPAQTSHIEYFQSVMGLLSRLKDKGLQVTEIGTRTIGNRQAKGWRIVESDDKREDMWLDVQTNLVLEINAHVLDQGQLKQVRHSTCTYDQNVPVNIRDSVPPVAQTVNYSPDLDPAFEKWNARLREIAAYYQQHPLPETMELLPRESEENFRGHPRGRLRAITNATGHRVWPVQSTLEDFLRPNVKPCGSVCVPEELRTMKLNYDLVARTEPTPRERADFVLNALGLEIIGVTEQRKVWVAHYDGRPLKPWQEVTAPVPRGDARHTMPGMASGRGRKSVRELFEDFAYYQDYHLSADGIIIVDETGLPSRPAEGQSAGSVAVSSVSPYWRGDESIPIARKWFKEQFGITFTEEMRPMTVHIVRRQQ
ncbi:MAG: hypothetical protein AMJ65_07895 [Phycisphaerae bacterium SG8_4]|nr:MAG: hypothetical protein AMJ65_07895 [Phycisphaerae bacterium SG8_4]